MTVSLSPFGYSGIRFAMLQKRGTLPPDRDVLWKMSGGRCFWCDRTMNAGGNAMSADFFTVDHYWPRTAAVGSRRGELKMAACRRCNIDRGDMPAEAYWQRCAERLKGSRA